MPNKALQQTRDGILRCGYSVGCELLNLVVSPYEKMTEYQVTFDDAFLVEMVRRYRQIHKWLWLRVALKLLATGFLAIAVVSSLHQQWWGMAAMWGAVVAVLWASPWIDYWRVKRRFRLSCLGSA